MTPPGWIGRLVQIRRTRSQRLRKLTDCECRTHNGFFTRAGYAQAKLEQGPELAGPLAVRYLDKVASVSASVVVVDDFEYDPNHIELNRRVILNGS